MQLQRIHFMSYAHLYPPRNIKPENYTDLLGDKNITAKIEIMRQLYIDQQLWMQNRFQQIQTKNKQIKAKKGSQNDEELLQEQNVNVDTLQEPIEDQEESTIDSIHTKTYTDNSESDE